MVVKFRKNRFGGNKMVEPPRDEKSTRERADRDQWKHTLGNARTKLMLEMEEFAFPIGDPLSMRQEPLELWWICLKQW